MGATHEVWLTDDRGTPVTLVENWERLTYSMAVHNVGSCTLVLAGDADKSLFLPDYHLEIWRDYDGGHRQLERVYFIRKPQQAQAGDGDERLYVEAYDANMLLDVRIIAYAAGTAYAKKTGAVDNLMKAFVRENCGTLVVDTDRAWNSSYFSVAADLGEGTTLTDFSGPWRNLLNVLRDLYEAARAAGSEIYFDLTPTTPTTFQFRTASGQLNADRSQTSGVNPVLVGSEFGNLTEVMVAEHYEEEATVAYAGGQGEGSDRLIVEVEDTARSGRSIWGRREAFQDARQMTSTNGVTAAANRRLAQGEPWLEFSGRLLDTPLAPYGEWRWGDKVSASYKGQSYDCLVRSIRVNVEREGGEHIDSRLELISP